MKEQSLREKPYLIFIYLTLSFLAILTIWDLFNTPYRSIIWFFSFTLLFYVYKKFKEMPKYIIVLLFLIAIVNVSGELFSEFFYKYQHFDKFLHAINPFIISIFFYHAFKDKISKKSILIGFCIFSTMYFAVLWEVFEYIVDTYLGAYMQGVYEKTQFDFINTVYRQTTDRITDTMTDIIWNLIGTGLFGILAYLSKNKKY